MATRRFTSLSGTQDTTDVSMDDPDEAMIVSLLREGYFARPGVDSMEGISPTLRKQIEARHDRSKRECLKEAMNQNRGRVKHRRDGSQVRLCEREEEAYRKDRSTDTLLSFLGHTSFNYSVKIVYWRILFTSCFSDPHFRLSRPFGRAFSQFLFRRSA